MNLVLAVSSKLVHVAHLSGKGQRNSMFPQHDVAEVSEFRFLAAGLGRARSTSPMDWEAACPGRYE